MKRPHLLRVRREPEAFAPLAEALAAEGLRLGWLDLGGNAAPPDALARAAGLPAFRAVAVGPEHTVSVKPRRGPAVVTDLLRESFLGCRLVLLTGSSEASASTPDLEPASPGRWRVVTEKGARELTTGELLQALRRPNPFG